MILDKTSARQLVDGGQASYLGNVWNHGELWAVISNHEHQRTDHFGPLSPDDPEFNAEAPDIVTL